MSVSASADALARIAIALQLSRAERAYLLELAAQRDPAEPDPASLDAPAALLQIVSLIGAPAYVLDRQWNALRWNEPAAELFVGWFDGEHDRNLLTYTFTSQLARGLIVDWETRERHLAAEFRADSIRHLNDLPTRADRFAVIPKRCVRALLGIAGRVRARRRRARVQSSGARACRVPFKPAHREDLKLVILVGNA